MGLREMLNSLTKKSSSSDVEVFSYTLNKSGVTGMSTKPQACCHVGFSPRVLFWHDRNVVELEP